MSNPPKYLESYIVSICRFNEESGAAVIAEFYGTAFFINSQGVFLTATHVMQAANEGIKSQGEFVGLCVQGPNGEGNLACRISSTEAADHPFDVTVGVVDAHFPTLFTLGPAQVTVWTEVASYGYPATALKRAGDALWMYARGFRGYVHRAARAGELQGGEYPDVFETSFSMPKGLSGGPLFVRGSDRDIVVGVCVGINRGESIEAMYEEVLANGETFKETRVRFEEYGIAHDIRPLLGWRPSNLHGRTLGEVIDR